MKELLSIFPFLFKKPDVEKGDRGERGEKGDKGDRGDKGEKGDKGDRGESTIEKLYPYIVPETDGVENALSFVYRSSKGLSPDYSSYTHYTNRVFDKYDFVAREQFVTAYEHLKMVVLDAEQKTILHIPDREKYSEIFKDFRLVPGSEASGVDISLSLKVMTGILGDIFGSEPPKPVVFNIYFFPDAKAEVKKEYTKIEILDDKIKKLETELKQMKKDLEMKFEIMKRDLEMRMQVSESVKRGK